NMSAMNMQLVIRGLLAYVLTGSYAALGLIGLAGAIPTLTLSVFGGVVADRLPRRTVMQVGQTASGLNAATLAALYFAGFMTFEWLLISSFVHGVTMALMMPSRQAMLTDIVPMDRMMNAVSLNMAGMNSMRLFAPALGGFIVAFAGFGWAFLVMAGLFGLAVLGMAQVTWAPSAAPSEGKQGPLAVAKNSLRDIGSGLAYMGRDRNMAVLLSIAFLTSMLGMPLQFMLPAYVADIFADNAGDAAGLAGLLLSISAIGALVGALTLATVRSRHCGWLLMAGGITLGLGTFLFAQTATFLVAGLAMMVVGLGSSMRQALSQGLLHAYVDNTYRGRVMAIFMMQMSVMQFGTFIVGIIAEQTGIQTVIAGLGISLIAVTLLYAALSPRLRRMD
ncbi:MAG: MFS transporter, partial [Chloroflexi bacterium]|nr:MFS transporter [Chloroflexota bacterium]